MRYLQTHQLIHLDYFIYFLLQSHYTLNIAKSVLIIHFSFNDLEKFSLIKDCLEKDQCFIFAKTIAHQFNCSREEVFLEQILTTNLMMNSLFLLMILFVLLFILQFSSEIVSSITQALEWLI